MRRPIIHSHMYLSMFSWDLEEAGRLVRGKRPTLSSELDEQARTGPSSPRKELQASRMSLGKNHVACASLSVSTARACMLAGRLFIGSGVCGPDCKDCGFFTVGSRFSHVLSFPFPCLPANNQIFCPLSYKPRLARVEGQFLQQNRNLPFSLLHNHRQNNNTDGCEKLPGVYLTATN